MKKSVKITTVEWFLDLIYPCYCRECGKIGAVLCTRCFFNNINKNRPFFDFNGKDFHVLMFSGVRTGVLSDLISQYKFMSRRHYREVLVKYLIETIKMCPKEKFVLVPLPTIRKHIRERGFDHIELLANELAKIYGYEIRKVLIRKNTSVQVGSSARMRKEQARDAYGFNETVSVTGREHFLLIDDVWTTGASMKAARMVLFDGLKKMGVKEADIKISAICLAKNGGCDLSN